MHVLLLQHLLDMHHKWWFISTKPKSSFAFMTYYLAVSIHTGEKAEWIKPMKKHTGRSFCCFSGKICNRKFSVGTSIAISLISPFTRVCYSRP